MKCGQVHLLVALCLCTGVLHTGAENLRSRLLDVCKEKNQPCDKKKDCCDGLNCVGPFTEGGTKTCQISHCIPDGKQCNNGKRPHECCDELICLLHNNGKQYCGQCRAFDEECANDGQCCDDLICSEGGTCAESCSSVEGPCSDRIGDCCEDLLCQRGRCCLPLGEPCDEYTNCCSYNCHEGECW